MEDLGPPVDPEGLVRLDVPELVIADGAVVATLLYVDSFGNIALISPATTWKGWESCRARASSSSSRARGTTR